MPYFSKVFILLILLVFFAGCKKSHEPSCIENKEITKKFQHGNLIKFQIMVLKSLKKGIFNKTNLLIIGNRKVSEKCVEKTSLCSFKSCLKDVDLDSLQIIDKSYGKCITNCPVDKCSPDIICKDVIWKLKDKNKKEVIISFEKIAELNGTIYSPGFIRCEVR